MNRLQLGAPKTDFGIYLSAFAKPEHLIAQAIVEGQVRPYEGARFIAYEVANSLWGNDLQREFVPFIGLASEYEDCEHYIQHPEDCRFLSQTPAEIRRELEHQIIEAARNFVNNPGGG